MAEKKYKDVQKTQNGRLWSVFVVPPLMIISALMPKIPTVLRIFLVVSGIALIYTAGYSFLETKKANQ